MAPAFMQMRKFVVGIEVDPVSSVSTLWLGTHARRKGVLHESHISLEESQNRKEEVHP